ncbi:hypothetical protein CH300_00180 [Rhodococcus sp. 15-1154-1]|nr:hypothetical protein [Rhodococcus sp. 15-1154-1]OZF09833.1 hypothetical protein CH300_00180 [Rhodococcus sp. 15-1154-1]
MSAPAARVTVAETNRHSERRVRIVLAALLFELDLFFQPEVQELRIGVDELVRVTIAYADVGHVPRPHCDLEQLVCA